MPLYYYPHRAGDTMDRSPAEQPEDGVADRALVAPPPDVSDETWRHNRMRFWFGAVGTILTLTIVLAPLGLPLLWAAHRHRAAAEWGSEASKPLGKHLYAVLRYQFSLEDIDGPVGEFTRGSGSSSDRSREGLPPRL